MRENLLVMDAAFSSNVAEPIYQKAGNISYCREITYINNGNMTGNQTADLRKSGLDNIEDVSWGTHFCQFYKTKEDLVDILVPYFKAGLENNELCMWVTATPLNVAEAENALRRAVPGLDQYLERGQLEIISFTDWYLKGGFFNSKRVFNGWVHKLNQARANGFDGLRLTGNTFWLEETDWRNFASYEAEIDAVFSNYRIIANCTYSLEKCTAVEVVDVLRNHEFALIKYDGKWEMIESSELKRAKETLKAKQQKIQQQNAELQALNKELQRTNEELKKNRNNLDLIVKERTKELNATNMLLRQSEKQYRQLIEVSPDAYIVYAKNKVLYANPAALRLFGNNEARKIDFNILQNLIMLDKCKKIDKLNGRIKSINLGEITINQGSLSPKTVEVSVIPVVFKGEEAKQYIIRDITQRISMEKEMARLDRLNLIGEMAAGIGHEVRNPMTCVRGFLQLLANQELDLKKVGYYDLMIEELDRANSIITEFLSLAKDRAVILVPASLDSIINSLYPLLFTDAMKQDKGIILKNGNIPDVLLNEKEIRQLIINLVRNGLEAMPPGRALTIGTYDDNDDVVFFVKDEGVGIKPEILDKIGTPFFTTKDKGTGLGLSVCYSIAEKHNAKIDVKTGSGGTTFYVRFKMLNRIQKVNVG